MARIPLLTLRDPAGKERAYRLALLACRIGRSHYNDVVLEDPRISRQHALLEPQGEEILFRNLSETNPLLRNGQRCFSGRLRIGDALQLGDSYVVFTRLVEETAEDAAARNPAQETDPAGTAAPVGTETVVMEGVDRARLGLLSDVVDVLPLGGDRDALLDRVLESLFRIMDVQRAAVALRSGARGELRIVASRNREPGGGEVAPSRTVLQKVLRTGRCLLAPDVERDADLAGVSSVVELGIRSILAVPLHAGEEVIGVLYADNRSRTRSFGEEDLSYVSLLGRVLSVQLENLALTASLREENVRLKRMLEAETELVAASPAMRKIMEVAGRVAASDANVLITGETGTGKNLLARAIHRMSPRAELPYLEFSCAAVPENLLEAELFGYGPMSGISGADPRGRAGYFETAGGGTILLDEIGDMDLALQAKILHALEGGSFRRLGSNDPHEFRCRILSATNRRLEQAVREEHFRADLYYRLRVVPLHLPPLRDRPEDIVPIAEALLQRLSGERRVRLAADARQLLLTHAWPGNVRELRNLLARALATDGSRALRAETLRSCLERGEEEHGDPLLSLAEVQRRHILLVLRTCGGNKTRAAEILGISRTTLYDWLKEA